MNATTTIAPIVGFGYAYTDEHGVPDAVLLNDANEDAFLANLRSRYTASKIYTYIGEVLIACNPYQELGLRDPAEAKLRFEGKALYQAEPHVFALAQAAYSTLRRTHRDTVVIISGESGAGKTEASKHVMKYIAAVNGSGQSAEIHRIKNMLLASNPLLEAFGNAKTVRNDNSSRFGKYMDILFDELGNPIGGHIKNFLLEKARVVRQSDQERNFHIFHQLLASADDSLLKRLQLSRSTEDYVFLKGTSHSGALNDKEGLQETLAAMEAIGFNTDLKETLFKLVAVVLHLGQLTFVKQGEGCAVSSTGVVQTLAGLLSTEVAALTKALTTRVVAARGEIYETQLTLAQAEVARDTLAKALYERLFSYLVSRINEFIAPKATGEALGVLDIYGFEIFPTNGFEQFCINFCNEKLQQLFIELVLQKEQEEYAREGIDWVEIEYFNNAEICAMMGKPKTGMIAALDEQCALPNGNDTAFLKMLDKQFGQMPRYSSKQTDGTDEQCQRERDFRIRHFAGDVVYSCGSFVEKNNDTLFQDLKRLLFNCGLDALKGMFPEGADELTQVHKMPYTAATGFRMSMDDLVANLMAKEPFYIRCIKPNNGKKALTWDDELCRHQTRYLGLMENLRVRRAGYCHRQVYEEFLPRYKMLAPKTWPHWHGKVEEGTKAILEAQGVIEDAAFGVTKLFLKTPKTLFALEAARAARIPHLVTKIQARWRGVLGRRRATQVHAVYTIFAFWKKHHARNYVVELADLFKGVKHMCDLGKSIDFPTPPNGLNSFAVTCKKIHSRWRAHTILSRFTPEQQEQLKQKALAQQMLKGRRAYWGYDYQWQGNYAVKSNDGPKFAAAMGPIMMKNGDHEIFFSSQVLKLNTKGKQDLRVLVVTDKHLYRLTPAFKTSRDPTPLSQVKGFAISSGEDQACVILLEGQSDLVVTLRGNACCAELVSLVARAANNLSLPVDVDNHIHYKCKGHDKSLKFELREEDETHFQRQGSGYSIIVRRQSLQRLRSLSVSTKTVPRAGPLGPPVAAQ